MSTKAGYHLSDIPKGELGTSGKMMEEILELIDAESQGSKIMALVELSDLYGAIKLYLNKNHPDIQMKDLETFSAITERAFVNGRRVSSTEVLKPTFSNEPEVLESSTDVLKQKLFEFKDSPLMGQSKLFNELVCILKQLGLCWKLHLRTIRGNMLLPVLLSDKIFEGHAYVLDYEYTIKVLNDDCYFFDSKDKDVYNSVVNALKNKRGVKWGAWTYCNSSNDKSKDGLNTSNKNYFYTKLHWIKDLGDFYEYER